MAPISAAAHRIIDRAAPWSRVGHRVEARREFVVNPDALRHALTFERTAPDVEQVDAPDDPRVEGFPDRFDDGPSRQGGVPAI